MKYPLIPFAIHKFSGRWLEVTEVEQGLNCDCMCPGCFGDLIAKQGEVNDWHFDHRSGDPEEVCYYAFTESLYGVIHQLLNQLSEFMTPCSALLCNRPVTVDTIEVSVEFDEYQVDFVIYTEDTQIAVVMTHPRRPFRQDLLNAIPKTYPVLELILSEYNEEFRNAEPENYRTRLLHLLSQSITAKAWRRIPEKCDFPLRPQFDYHCIGCGSRWQSHAYAHLCETCRSPLLSLQEPSS